MPYDPYSSIKEYSKKNRKDLAVLSKMTMNYPHVLEEEELSHLEKKEQEANGALETGRGKMNYRNIATAQRLLPLPIAREDEYQLDVITGHSGAQTFQAVDECSRKLGTKVRQM